MVLCKAKLVSERGWGGSSVFPAHGGDCRARLRTKRRDTYNACGVHHCSGRLLREPGVHCPKRSVALLASTLQCLSLAGCPFFGGCHGSRFPETYWRRL